MYESGSGQFSLKFASYVGGFYRSVSQNIPQPSVSLPRDGDPWSWPPLVRYWREFLPNTHCTDMCLLQPLPPSTTTHTSITHISCRLFVAPASTTAFSPSFLHPQQPPLISSERIASFVGGSCSGNVCKMISFAEPRDIGGEANELRDDATYGKDDTLCVSEGGKICTPPATETFSHTCVM